MKIQEKDFYHGAALTQITEHPSFKALNTAGSGHYGHYLINADRHVFVKYRTGNGRSWNHVFSIGELNTLRAIFAKQKFVWHALVCGDLTVCLLSKDDVERLIDVQDQEQQRIKVDVPQNGSCHVSGTLGELPHVVRHNDFPARLFQ
ncbi:hypothetical protein [Burkholderia oklahomensis]|uniref:Uncharacterized protein n=1 Tax=Burkholderia oklahomensis TaxID=342113 RepID=A0AAI8BDX1_9BURK|nr:hypothetical protein [Burkholderia oklahomensis]AIO70487.1 hypothetical protein DM82_4479 [Burkholderia oklahomensis]AJX36083.1 hypothetical protein BG90_6098 [Burkholderia oklahomensis C6786]MBI0362034.1 hypothetical protein [Burkholderia oklahomensis]QPS39627.1 hypothetical protein I6G57_27795 [Burkholderia oklahomensis]SUY28981.1 Uncharacterised protein [Burkholderia oklahomensis]